MKKTYQELFKLKSMADALREVEEKENKHPLTDELLKALIRYYKNSFAFEQKHGDNVQEKIDSFESLFQRPYSSACGCIGPRDGDPLCGCVMDELRYLYRYDIALALSEEELTRIQE